MRILGSALWAATALTLILSSSTNSQPRLHRDELGDPYVTVDVRGNIAIDSGIANFAVEIGIKNPDSNSLNSICLVLPTGTGQLHAGTFSELDNTVVSVLKIARSHIYISRIDTVDMADENGMYRMLNMTLSTEFRSRDSLVLSMNVRIESSQISAAPFNGTPLFLIPYIAALRAVQFVDDRGEILVAGGPSDMPPTASLTNYRLAVTYDSSYVVFAGCGDESDRPTVSQNKDRRPQFNCSFTRMRTVPLWIECWKQTLSSDAHLQVEMYLSCLNGFGIDDSLAPLVTNTIHRKFGDSISGVFRLIVVSSELLETVGNLPEFRVIYIPDSASYTHNIVPYLESSITSH